MHLNKRHYVRIAKKILREQDKMKRFSDDQLRNQTAIFRKKIKNGVKIKKLLIPAFATVAESSRRILGLSPYLSQIIGAIILYEGDIAEMKTGEGKTLSATMPLYLNGLLGPGNFLITANEYLARRDVEILGDLYRFLGVSISVGVSADDDDDSQRNREQIYSSDIVYTTHSGLGFDYLFDNLASSEDEQYLPHLNYVIIDEIDSILLDQAQTPLIVSGAPRVQSNLYQTSENLVHILNKNEDFELSDDNKNVWFTENGITKIEEYLGVDNVLLKKYKDIYRHLVIALKANHLFLRDRNYVVEDDKVILLDKTNGRKLLGTKLQSGLHQAIEAKEGVSISAETRAMATITYQNLFRLFKKIAGMTGTAKTDANEFRDTYGLNTIVVPTNKKNIRVDHKDSVYITNRAKITASLNEVRRQHELGRPILIETGSVSMSDLYSRILLNEGYVHSVLNATSVSKEKKIIDQAGDTYSITVATALAGRGTDIKLTEQAKSNGGLFVLGTERMSSERIDNQLRGRAGRQGEPGDSVFYVSLEDKIILENSPNYVKKFRKKNIQNLSAEQINRPIKKKRFQRVVNRAQKVQKSLEESERMQTLEYDEVMKVQRQILYKTREKIIKAETSEKWLTESFEKAIKNFVEAVRNQSDLMDFIYNNIDYNFIPKESSFPMEVIQNSKKMRDYLRSLVNDQSKVVNDRLFDPQQRQQYKKIVLLKSLDSMWIEQVDTLNQLKIVVNDRNWGQHNPIYEYQEEARRSFKNMKDGVYRQVLKNYLLSDVIRQKDGSIEVVFP